MGGGASKQTTNQPLTIQTQIKKQSINQKLDAKPTVSNNVSKTNKPTPKDNLNNSKIQAKATYVPPKIERQKSIEDKRNSSIINNKSIEKKQNNINKSITTTKIQREKTLENLRNSSIAAGKPLQKAQAKLNRSLTTKKIDPAGSKKQSLVLPQISLVKRQKSKSKPLNKVIQHEINQSSAVTKALETKLYTGVNFGNSTSSSYRASKKNLTSSSLTKITASGSKLKRNTLKQNMRNQEVPEVQPQNEQDHKIKTKSKSKKHKVDPKIIQLMKLYGI